MDYCPIKSNFAVMKHPLDKFRYCPVCGSERFEVNNVKSKKCQACGFTYYMNPSAATVAVITKESGRGEGLLLLVVRRGKEPAKGTLDLPGGFSDMGETSEQGVAREVLEETGLHVVLTEFLFSLPNRYVYSGLEIPTMDMFYRCEVAETVDALHQSVHAMDDAAEAMWVPISELNPDDFGLESIRRGVKMLKERLG
jgi:ADP-ribose pyrophosphatase YjhB (NUDIX family)